VEQVTGGPVPSVPGRETPSGHGADDSRAETRAARRARREAEEGRQRRPAPSPGATMVRPVTVIATVAVCGLLVLAVAADPVLLAAGLAWTGLLLCWGWPALLGSSSRVGSSLAIGVTGVGGPVAVLLAGGEPYLRLVPLALVGGLGLMFGHQLVRRDGRPRLTESIGVTAFGLALVAAGAAWVPLAYRSRSVDIAVVALVAVAGGSIADLLTGSAPMRPWLLPTAMALGGGIGVAAGAALGSAGLGSAALVGVVVAAVSHAMRRVLMVLPAIGSVRSQLSVAAAGVLVPGVVAYVLGLALVG
jgi:hypothetical protein